MDVWEEHDGRVRAEIELKCLQGQYDIIKKMYDECFNYFNDKYPDEMGNVLGIKVLGIKEYENE